VAALDQQLQFPTDYVAITTMPSSGHKAVDLGWSSAKGGANVPIKAPADGKVVSILNTKVNDKKTKTKGNYVTIYHGDFDINGKKQSVYTRSCHLLKGSVIVKVGDMVKQGQQVAKMNNSGYSFGNHNHFELMFGGGANDKRRQDILKWVVLYPHQSTNTATASKVRKYIESALPIPVVRNTQVNQVEVLVKDLNCRSGAGKNYPVLTKGKYTPKGIYNVLTKQTVDGLVWCEVEPSKWIGTNDSAGWTKMLNTVAPINPLEEENKRLRKIIADAIETLQRA